MIKCMVCDGSLRMSLDGSGAVCPSCGIAYPLELLRNIAAANRKAQPTPPESAPEPSGTAPAAPAIRAEDGDRPQPAKPQTVRPETPTAAPEGPNHFRPESPAPAPAVTPSTSQDYRPVAPVSPQTTPGASQGYRPVAPVSPQTTPNASQGYRPVASVSPQTTPNASQGYRPVAPVSPQTTPNASQGYRPAAPQRPLRQIDNAKFGLSMAERRWFGYLTPPVPPTDPKPPQPGILASKLDRQLYNNSLNRWQEGQNRYLDQKARYDGLMALRRDYYRKLYEQIWPEYTPEEWRPYFEKLLRENFPACGLRQGVSLAELTGDPRDARRQVDFVLDKGGAPVLAIFLRRNAKTALPRSALSSRGITAMRFVTKLSNRADYVVDRVRKALTL